MNSNTFVTIIGGGLIQIFMNAKHPKFPKIMIIDSRLMLQRRSKQNLPKWYELERCNSNIIVSPTAPFAEIDWINAKYLCKMEYSMLFIWISVHSFIHSLNFLIIVMANIVIKIIYYLWQSLAFYGDEFNPIYNRLKVPLNQFMFMRIVYLRNVYLFRLRP